MSELWCREYIHLAFRINKALYRITDNSFVDAYYGPPEWRSEVEHEPEMTPSDLVREAMTLADSFSDQDFDVQRRVYLEKQVIAMETVCRVLSGESFSLEEQVQHCFDIRPAWIPETQFDEAFALYDEALPGKGTLARRLHEWRRQHQLPWDKRDLLPKLMQRILAEIRRRTQAFIDLPPDEGIDLQTVTEKFFGAACWYQGNYRSLIEVNTSLPSNLNTLVDTLCHEAYPGHHAEFVMKEQHLYRQHGHFEQTIALLICPQALISEGIAMLACEMIFAPGEVEHWLAREIYPEVGLEIIPGDMIKINRARDLLEGVRCNAAFMLHEGRSEAEIIAYMANYMQPTELGLLRMPLEKAYVFTYYYGKQLMQPWLQGDDRQAVFRRFLREAISPSDLVGG